MEADNIGNFCRAQRKDLRLSQQEVADLAEVSERFVRNLESGKSSVQLDKTLAVLGVLGFDMVPQPHNASFSAVVKP